MGVAVTTEEESRQGLYLNKIKPKISSLQSKNQILKEQIENQEQEIKLLIKRQSLIEDKDVVNPLTILYQWIHSQKTVTHD